MFILASQVGSRIESSDPPFITYTNKVYKGFLNTKDIYSPKTTTLGLRIVNLMFLYSSGSFRVKLKIYRAPKGKDGLPDFQLSFCRGELLNFGGVNSLKLTACP